MRATLTVVLAACLVFSANHPASARKARTPKKPPCNTARQWRFLSPAPFVPGQTSTSDALILDGVAKQASIGSTCSNGKATFTRKRGFTSVGVTFPACAGLEGKVTLKAHLAAPACDTLAGWSKARKRRKSHFSARLSRCGDGVRDPGNDEQCDGNSSDCPLGTTCTSDCTCASASAASSTSSTSTTTSTTCTSAGVTTTTVNGCCGPERIRLVSSAGTLTVDNLTPFPFPSGIMTTMDTGAPTPGTCEHDVVLPPGGFSVPNFDIPALNFCSSVILKHCESGNGEGAGALWDGYGTPDVAMTNVSKVGDTSDGVCGTLGAGCVTTAGGAGADTLGDVDETVSAAPGGGVRSLLDIPAESLTWNDSVCSPAITPGCCVKSQYGDDTPTNGEFLVSLFDFILSPTTNVATGAFVDKNSDGCDRAGSGFSHPGPDGPKSLTGSPAPGPCCVEGQATTVVAVGIGFSGGAPLYDLGFQSTTPNVVAHCCAPGSSTCVVTTDPCLK